jgi:leader peptidase (prepilin peptidase) / N-methyltransferase
MTPTSISPAARLDSEGVGTTAEDTGNNFERWGRAPIVRHRVPVAVLAVGAAGLGFASYPVGAAAAIAAFLAAVLVVLAATDLERRIIPNRIVLPATVTVLIARVVFFPGHAPEYALAAVGAAAAFLIPNLVSSSAMGMGDVKLVLLLGAGLGWGVIGAVVLAFLCCFPFALVTIVRDGFAVRGKTIPFGPFLALGALIILIVPRLAGLGGS